jgi:hypothetical protein
VHGTDKRMDFDYEPFLGKIVKIVQPDWHDGRILRSDGRSLNYISGKKKKILLVKNRDYRNRAGNNILLIL